MLIKVTIDSFSFVLIITLAIILIGILFSNRIIKPIEELIAASDKIAGGDWVVKIRSQTKDEIGQLINSFVKMSQELAKRDLQLHKTQRDLVKTERLAALGKFSAGIAHEVKNPLNSILGYAQLLQRKITENFDPSFRQYVEFILDETRRANRIISDLMSFARQSAPPKSKIVAGDVLNYAADSMTPLLQQAKIQLNRPEHMEKLYVEANRDQLVQVLTNLITNAIHALEETATPAIRKIELGLRLQNQYVLFTVADNGPGISKENLERIFEPFFTTKKTGKGTGLGLAFCYGIIQQHNGRVEVHSQINQGTEFVIYLPVYASRNNESPITE